MRQPIPGNPVVFLDFQIGKEAVGRMIIELRKDVVPLTAENFRRLCVGDFVSPTTKRQLAYKGTKIHRVQRIFAICGGTIGKIGESIYGETFPDENFQLRHELGAVSMSNYGPNTNNSQFFITRTDCPNLDSTHVVFGHVLRGFDIIPEMEKMTTEDGVPTTDITIINAGQLDPEEPWNYYDLDDNLPPFPTDWLEADKYTTSQDAQSMLELLERIKSLGNGLYARDTVAALRKYKKVGRYHQFFVDVKANSGQMDTTDEFDKLRLNNLLNMAACQLKLGLYQNVISVCDEVLRNSPDQSKAYYRRGVAAIELKEYDTALEDLKQAYALIPNDSNVLEQFNRGKELLLEYRKKERVLSQKMCKDLNL